MGGLAAFVDMRADLAVATAAVETMASRMNRRLAGRIQARAAVACALRGEVAAWGSIRVGGDVRLDEEEELASSLGAPGERGLGLIARAFERWGSECVHRLRGDLAFVAVDIAAGVAFVARDPFGVKPLAYRRTTSGLAVASDPVALAALGDVSVDDDAICDFLEGDERSSTLTFFRGVSRLAAGHAMTLGAEPRRWYAPPGQGTRTQRETIEGFRERLQDAVARRLVPGPVLVQMSGGLDSSSIACLADGARDVTIASAIFEHADERRYVDAVESKLSRSIEKLTAVPNAELDDPLDPNHPSRYPLAAMTTKLTALAGQRRARALVSGTGGDELLFERGVFRDLLAHGRILRLFREAPRYSTRTRGFYLRDAIVSAIPERARASWRRLRRRRAPARPSWLRAKRTAPVDAPVLALSSETARFTWEWLTGPRLAATLEAEDRASARSDLEMRYPFLDADLASFVLATPYSHRLPGGRMKALLRDALAADLPPLVRDRTVPTTFDLEIAGAIAKKLEHVHDAIARGPWLSERWVDRSAAEQLLSRFRADTSDSTLAMQVWDIAMLEHWLRAL